MNEKIPTPDTTQDKIKCIVINGVDSAEYKKHEKELREVEETGIFLEYTGALNDHLFSAIDSSNKFTKELFECTGIVLFGTEKNTSKTISCISHVSNIAGSLSLINILKEKHYSEQYKDETDDWKMPTILDKYQKFEEEAHLALKAFRDMVEPTSVSVHMFGGQVREFDSKSTNKNFSKKSIKAESEYAFSKEIWQSIISNYFDTKIIIANQPAVTFHSNYGKDGVDVYINNNKKEIYIVYRARQDFSV